MQYKTFGQTGIRVSTLGYGALRLPTLEDETCDFEKSLPLLTECGTLLTSVTKLKKGSSLRLTFVKILGTQTLEMGIVHY
jgi:hypothetical protein